MLRVLKLAKIKSPVHKLGFPAIAFDFLVMLSFPRYEHKQNICKNYVSLKIFASCW